MHILTHTVTVFCAHSICIYWSYQVECRKDKMHCSGSAVVFIAPFMLLIISNAGFGRKAPALDEICARGSYAFCPNNGTSSRQLPGPATADASSNSRDLPAAPSQTQQGGLATPPSLPTVGDYCDKYKDHYKYFCGQNNNATKDARASDFCTTYQNYCAAQPDSGGNTAANPTPTPELPPAKIQQMCSDYQAMANQYCFRPQIPKGWSIKKSCDMYLKYCVATAQDQLAQQNKSMQDVLRQNIKPCDKFQNDYIGFCVQNPKPYNDQVAEFCKNYKSTCVPTQLPTADQLAGQNEAVVAAAPQSQQAAVAAATGGGGTGSSSSLGASGDNPWSKAGSPVAPLPLGNPDIITNPLGSLGGANPGPSLTDPNNGGLGANPLTVGSQTGVGNIAGVSSGTAVNPFGQVATGKSVLAGPVGVQSGQAVDFSGIPGLSQIGAISGLGRKRRRRKRNIALFTVPLRSH